MLAEYCIKCLKRGENVPATRRIPTEIGAEDRGMICYGNIVRDFYPYPVVYVGKGLPVCEEHYNEGEKALILQTGRRVMKSKDGWEVIE